MPEITPFELSLQSELEVEGRRFGNEWLFKWHGMTYERGVTDVDSFDGGRIHYQGINFGYQQQQIFWQAIKRYLQGKVHATFRRWDEETKSYPSELRRSSLEGTSRLMMTFVAGVMKNALET